MIKNTEFENLINTLPVRIQKQKKIKCYCGAEHEKLVTYKLQLNIDRSYGLNGHFRPQYNLYYKCSDFSIGNPNRYINSGLRVSDILKLKVEDVIDTDFVRLREKKTGKYKMFPLRADIKKLLAQYTKNRKLSEPIFMGNKGAKLDRSQVYRMINRACTALGIEGNVGTHTMRKTFGYHHYKQFRDIALLQTIFNHSSPQITMRYIGITQDKECWLNIPIE